MNIPDFQNHIEYKNGYLYWFNPTCRSMKPGEPVGSSPNENGYPRFKFKGKYYQLSKVVFYLHHGYLPDFLRSIDGNKSNIDINNLKELDRSDMQGGRKKNKAGGSNYKGVTLSTDHKKYRAYINKDCRRYHLGYFTNPIEAALAYDKKALELFGEYALTNFNRD